MPYKLLYQLVYLIYRWVSFLFYFAYIIRTGVAHGSFYYFQYLTNWGMITLVAHLLWSTVTVTYTFVRILVLKKPPHKPCHRHEKELLDKPPGCCGTSLDSTSWYHKTHWVLFTVSSEVAIGITLLYFGLLHDPESEIDDINAVTHLLNGLLSIIDVWVTGVPIRIYHFYFGIIYGSIYSVFTGIHHAALVIPNTTDPIYSPLDYESYPGVATFYSIFVPLVFLPLVHLFLYGNYLLREAFVFAVRKKCMDEKKSDRLWNDEEDGIEIK